MFSFFAKLLPAVRSGLALNRLWRSTTTNTQLQSVAGVGTVVAVAVAYVATLYPQLLTSEVQLALVTAIVTVLSPLVSRVVAFARKGDISGLALDPTTFCVRVRTDAKSAWIRYNATLMDAYQEGWDQCVVVTDVDLCATGATFRARVYDLKRNAIGEEFELSDNDDKWLRGLIAEGATVPDLDMAEK